MLNSKTKLLIILVALTCAAGFAYWKILGSSPQGQQSKADDGQPHWSHSTLPFSLPLVYYTSPKWLDSISTAANNWAKSGVINYKPLKGGADFSCYPISIPLNPGMNVCSINMDNDWLVVAGYGYNVAEPDHINSGIVILNDKYFLGRGSPYNTSAMKNKMVCQWLGWTAGMQLQYDAANYSKSCLNAEYDFKSVLNQQGPDDLDLTNMKTLYGHFDNNAKTLNPISKLAGSDETLAEKADQTPKQITSTAQLGRLVGSDKVDNIDYYELDMGNGNVLNSEIIKAK